jgi:GYD domain-containing protein
VRKLIEAAGGKFINFYFTTGDSDFLLISEANDAESIIAALNRSRLSRLNFWTKVCLPESFLRSRAARQRGRNQKNPGDRGKGNGVNVSNGSSKSARKNTASVSAEPTTNSNINSLS